MAPPQQVQQVEGYSYPPPAVRGGVRGRGGARRARGGRRRGGGRGRGGNSVVTGSGNITVVDTEYFAPESNKLVALVFNPSNDKLPRLNKFETMYTRYKINSVNIKFCPATSAMTAGSLYFGVLPGPANAQVTSPDTIIKIRPSRVTSVWQGASIGVGGSIDTARTMVCGDASVDGVAFTLYYHFGAATSGQFQISYNITFSYPKPF